MEWSPLRVGMPVVVTAVIYTGEWLLSVPAPDALVDATLGGFVSLLILGSAPAPAGGTR